MLGRKHCHASVCLRATEEASPHWFGHDTLTSLGKAAILRNLNEQQFHSSSDGDDMAPSLYYFFVCETIFFFFKCWIKAELDGAGVLCPVLGSPVQEG